MSDLERYVKKYWWEKNFEITLDNINNYYANNDLPYNVNFGEIYIEYREEINEFIKELRVKIEDPVEKAKTCFDFITGNILTDYLSK